MASAATSSFAEQSASLPAPAKFAHIRYADPLYWETRYRTQPASFDWFCGYQALRRLIRETITRKKPCLHVGCGNSNLQEGMGLNGYAVVNIDISEVVVDQMKALHAHIPQLTYQVGDVTKMEFADCTFGSALDKGTLDALMCSKDADAVAGRMFSEISRVLVPGGTFLVITLGDPSLRLPLLAKPELGWSVGVYLIPRIKEEQLVPQDNAVLPINDTVKPVKYIGPLPVTADGQIEGLPQPWQPREYFYAYACKKHPLVLSLSKQQKGCMPESWCKATRETMIKVQQEMGLSPDVLTRGTRKRSIKIRRGTSLFDLPQDALYDDQKLQEAVAQHHSISCSGAGGGQKDDIGMGRHYHHGSRHSSAGLPKIQGDVMGEVPASATDTPRESPSMELCMVGYESTTTDDGGGASSSAGVSPGPSPELYQMQRRPETLHEEQESELLSTDDGQRIERALASQEQQELAEGQQPGASESSSLDPTQQGQAQAQQKPAAGPMRSALSNLQMLLQEAELISSQNGGIVQRAPGQSDEEASGPGEGERTQVSAADDA